MNGSTTITAVGTIQADDSEEFTHEFEDSAVVTRLKASTYVGHEYGLRYRFYKRSGGSNQNVTRSLGRDYLAGNGENFDLVERVTFRPGDTLVIEIENATGRDGVDAQTYHHNARVTADYDAGSMVDELGPVRAFREFVGGLVGGAS